MVDKRFKYLDHTADVKFQAYGKTLNEAFSNLILATTNVLTDVNKIQNNVEKTIKIKAKTKESLLFDLVNELIFLLDTEMFISGKVESMKILKLKDSFSLSTKLHGDNCKHYEMTGDIKAPTYNFMFIKEKKNETTIQMVLDL